MWKAYFAGKSAELLHHGYAVWDEFVEPSLVATVVLDVLKRPTSIVVERLQTIFDQAKCTFSVEEVVKNNNNWNL